MSCIRTVHNRDNPYVMLNKAAFESHDLSWEAKGLWGYLMSRPDNWMVSVNHLKKIYKDRGGGRDAIRSMLKELIQAGYAIAEKHKKANGEFSGIDYIVFEHPREIKKMFPETGFPAPESAGTVNPTQQNNDVLTEEREQTNKQEEDAVPDQVPCALTPVAPEPEDSLFVCSSSSKLDANTEDKIDMLKALSLDDNSIQTILAYKSTLEEFRAAVAATLEAKPDNIAKFLSTAVKKKWKPNESHARKPEENKEWVINFHKKVANLFKIKAVVSILSSGVLVESGGASGLSFEIPYTDRRFQDKLRNCFLRMTYPEKYEEVDFMSLTKKLVEKATNR